MLLESLNAFGEVEDGMTGECELGKLDGLGSWARGRSGSGGRVRNLESSEGASTNWTS